MRLITLQSMLALLNFHAPMLTVIEPIVRRNISIAAMDDYFYATGLGLEREQVRELFDALEVPAFFLLNNALTEHRYNFSGEIAFLYWLYHWRQPHQTMADDQGTFGYDYSTLSKVINTLAFI